MGFIKIKKCTTCRKEKPYMEGYFRKDKKTKSGLTPTCLDCHAHKTKIYMRKHRLAYRLKKLGLYDGVISKLELGKLNRLDLVDIAYEVSRQLLYSGQKSRFCVECEKFHQDGHNKKREKKHNLTKNNENNI